MVSKRDRVLERAFQEHIVQIGQSHGGFVSKFKPNKVWYRAEGHHEDWTLWT